MFNKDITLEIFNEIAKTMDRNKDLLTELDAAIGDADHGINMTKGFTAVKNKLESIAEENCSTILKTVAMTFISSTGGASGPLFGTAFLKASSSVAGKENLSNDDLLLLFESAIKGIQMRGKAQKGEKTMLDALIPAYEAMKESLVGGDTLTVALNKAEIAALKGVEYTKTIIATKGRASYLGERSIGHQDPGATSCYLILKTINNALKNRESLVE
ncbi:MAG: dihydroxyacetone kinase subunit DhaL [Alkaliphilus sp.]